MNAKTESNPTETRKTIKLGIDAHAKWLHVGRQVDGATPQPVQEMTFEGLLRFVAKQQRLARGVYTCYEAERQTKIPKGVGPLCFEVLRREVGDWSRFNNHREVSSCVPGNTAAAASDEVAVSTRAATPESGPFSWKWSGE